MNVDVDKLKSKFINKVNDMMNQEVYFIDVCKKFPDRQTGEDLSLQIFFQENNKIIIDGTCVKFCQKNANRFIKIKDISSDISFPDINITNNYIVDRKNYTVEDQWEQTDW